MSNYTTCGTCDLMYYTGGPLFSRVVSAFHGAMGHGARSVGHTCDRGTAGQSQTTASNCPLCLHNDIANRLKEAAPKPYEEVDHPPHYSPGTYEVIKVLQAWELDKSFCLGNAVKYLARCGKKPGQDALTDLKKAQWYLAAEISRRTAPPPAASSGPAETPTKEVT